MYLNFLGNYYFAALIYYFENRRGSTRPSKLGLDVHVTQEEWLETASKIFPGFRLAERRAALRHALRTFRDPKVSWLKFAPCSYERNGVSFVLWQYCIRAILSKVCPTGQFHFWNSVK